MCITAHAHTHTHTCIFTHTHTQYTMYISAWYVMVGYGMVWYGVVCVSACKRYGMVCVLYARGSHWNETIPYHF